MTMRSSLKPKEPRDRLILPLDDCEDVSAAKRLIDKLAPHAGTFKIGLDLITAGLAPEIATYAESGSDDIMYDGKFSDIPKTVERAVKRVAAAGHKMFTIHANCGRKSLEAAAKVKGNSLMLAVTVLTSLDYTDLLDMGYMWPPVGGKQARLNPSISLVPVVFEKLAALAKLAGANGIVCSPWELCIARNLDGVKDLLKVVPGVRPTWTATNDQKRVMTPGEAIRAGADMLVIGRPITQAPDPVEAAKKVLDEIAQACAKKEGSP